MFRTNAFNKTFMVAIALSALCMASAHSAHAQTIRMFSPQSSGLFEVIEGSNTGGRFVRQNRGFLNCQPIVEYTDRVSRREKIIFYFGDRGVATRVGTQYNGAVRTSWPNVALPNFIVDCVSSNPNDDNMYAFLQICKQTWCKRVPIGTR